MSNISSLKISVPYEKDATIESNSQTQDDVIARLNETGLKETN